MIVTAAVLAVVAVVATLLIVAGDDGGADSAEGIVLGRRLPTDATLGDDTSMREDAPDASGAAGIIGGESGVEGRVLAAAVVDIEEFWTDEMPSVFGIDYEPISGGLYSWSRGEDFPPCVESVEMIAGNAFYCSLADNVAWDDEELIPDLYSRFGDLSVAMVLAHEWGHAIQARVGMDAAFTVTFEQQADCYAGAWVDRVRDGGSEFFVVDGPALDQAVGGLLELGDFVGSAPDDANAHGSAFDRLNAFKEGLDEGAEVCATYTDELVGDRLVQLPFFDRVDLARGGDAPYDEVLDFTTDDLEDYWSLVADDAGVVWETLEPSVPFDGTTDDAPRCGNADTSGFTLFYCAPGRFIAYDDVGLFPTVYDELGDFAVGALYGSQYSLAAQDQLDVAPDDTRTQNLMADCMTGTWTASVFLQNRPSSQMVLSPGDFDEAVKVLLALGSGEEGSTRGSGFERVSAFRDGVVDGMDACLVIGEG